MKRKSRTAWRSDCPLNIALEIFGDRWTLLVLRDLLLKGLATFREFQASSERIASNILADRIKKLVEYHIITSQRNPDDARIVTYRPTAKGLDLLPVIIEMIAWADRYEQTAAPANVMRRLKTSPDAFIAEVRSRFEK